MLADMRKQLEALTREMNRLRSSGGSEEVRAEVSALNETVTGLKQNETRMTNQLKMMAQQMSRADAQEELIEQEKEANAKKFSTMESRLKELESRTTALVPAEDGVAPFDRFETMMLQMKSKLDEYESFKESVQTRDETEERINVVMESLASTVWRLEQLEKK